ncbi:hypothetical protein CP970_21995 [Streptomyces kanamyceticus]|uniref:DUF2092 domain-containing protein n=2 Tax=Streptomyces kanamyceticus TaxID=1967 RepID=A0A5J6GFJ7_STRKN|nr:hypothetical protein [Streptomyces kanamyceticus]QEU93242.1 hypothetical protein CP970_21995 [Streptomyces kanamyceticus]
MLSRLRRTVPFKLRVALLVLAALGALSAAAAVALPDEEAPRPVTLDEAQRLAMARFSAYESGTMRVDVVLDDGSGTTSVHGLADFRTHHAVGRYAVTGSGGTSDGLLAWDSTGLAVASAPARVGGASARADGAAAAAKAAAAVKPRAWSPRAYTEDSLDSALRLVMGLANDRPDNPQLLAQGGPRHLREETLDGTSYTVFAGPRPRGSARDSRSPLTFWVDGQGRLGRVEARIAPLPRPARIDFAPAPAGLRVPGQPWAAAPGGGPGGR